MPGTWDEWSKEALKSGIIKDTEMTPENQEAVAKWKYAQFFDILGDERLVSVAWASGLERAIALKNAQSRLNKGDASAMTTVNTILGRTMGGGLKETVAEYVKKTTGRSWDARPFIEGTTPTEGLSIKGPKQDSPWYMSLGRYLDDPFKGTFTPDTSPRKNEYMGLMNSFRKMLDPNTNWPGVFSGGNKGTVNNQFSLGDININVTNPNASAEEIAAEAKKAVNEKFDSMQTSLARQQREFGGVFQ
jgi:hypothetical protein